MLKERFKHYILGDEVLDAEHYEMIIALETALTLIDTADRFVVVPGILDNFIKLFKKHVQSEEKYMRSHNYPYLAAHSAIHDAVLARIEQTMTHINRSTIQDLIAYFFDYIDHSDRQFIEYVNKKNSKRRDTK